MSLFPETIETDRLRLTRLSRDRQDPLELYEHARAGAPNIGEITRYLSWAPHDSPGATLEFVDHVEQQWSDDTGATYVIRPRGAEDGAGELAGTTGLSIDWECRTGDLGIWLRKRFWGRGYSGERAAALMQLAFERLDLDLVAVEHFVGNENSKRAIEGYIEAHGGRHEGLLRNHRSGDGDPVDVHRYSVSNEEYRTASGHETSVSFLDG